MQSSLKDYLIKLGAKEKNTSSFYESFDHPVLGTINFIENGKRVGLNFLSSFMRNNCGYGTAERKKFPNDKREKIYRECLESKPYYKDIKEGLKFHFKASGTDYVSLSLDLGSKKLKSVIDHELRP